MKRRSARLERETRVGTRKIDVPMPVGWVTKGAGWREARTRGRAAAGVPSPDEDWYGAGATLQSLLRSAFGGRGVQGMQRLENAEAFFCLRV